MPELDMDGSLISHLDYLLHFCELGSPAAVLLTRRRCGADYPSCDQFSGNRIEALPPIPFSGPGRANLQRLYLSYNRITVISTLHPSSRSMRTLSVLTENCPHGCVLRNSPVTRGGLQRRSQRLSEEDSLASSVRLFESDLIGNQDSSLAVRGSKSGTRI